MVGYTDMSVLVYLLKMLLPVFVYFSDVSCFCWLDQRTVWSCVIYSHPPPLKKTLTVKSLPVKTTSAVALSCLLNLVSRSLIYKNTCGNLATSLTSAVMEGGRNKKVIKSKKSEQVKSCFGPSLSYGQPCMLSSSFTWNRDGTVC